MKHIISLLAVTFFSLSVLAQSGTVRGFVYDGESGSPILYTNVILQGTSYGATTDDNGFYIITNVPVGDYTLFVTSLGYDTAKVNITVGSGRTVSKQLYIKESTIGLGVVNIDGERQEAKTTVKMSVTKLTPKEITKLPTIGGEADLAQYLQVVPGVVFTGDQGGQLYIRGGSPVQNKVLLDGMVIYNPFHSIGLFSVFETDIINSADIYTGGFGAEYGGRISSIMDISTRDGNKKHLSGKVGLSMFGAKAIIEGPLVKSTEEKPGGISFLLSGKTAYLDETSKTLYSYIDSAGIPFDYTDLYGKITFHADNGSKLDLFGLNFSDEARLTNAGTVSWKNTGGGGRFLIVPTASNSVVEGNFAYSSYLVKQEGSSLGKRESGVDGFNINLNAKYFNDDDEIMYGFEVSGFTTDFTYENSAAATIDQQDNNTELSGFFKYKLNHGKVVFEPSVRMQYYASFNQARIEPRAGLKYNAGDRIRFKLAAGTYSQNLMAANSDRDVVNLFYGFLSGPEDLQDEFTTEDGQTIEVKNRLQISNHYIFGTEVDITDDLSLNVEGYLKDFPRLTNLNRNKIYEDTPQNSDKRDIDKKDFILESSKAYGVDMALKYERKRIYIWAVYSLGKVTRWDGIRTYAPVFDRRHNVNLVASWTFGENLDWELGARWNLGSGLPFTPQKGVYEQINFGSDLSNDYTTDNGDLAVVLGELNSARLPYYHRFDVTLKKTWAVFSNAELEANIGVTNLYNRENLFYIDRLTFERSNQLPFMPNASLSFKF